MVGHAAVAEVGENGRDLLGAGSVGGPGCRGDAASQSLPAGSAVLPPLDENEPLALRSGYEARHCRLLDGSGEMAAGVVEVDEGRLRSGQCQEILGYRNRLP